MHDGMPTSRYLDLSKLAMSRTVEFIPSVHLTSGSAKKAVQAIQLVRSAFRQRLKCIVIPAPSGITIQCPEASVPAILNASAAVEEKLDRLQREHLTANMVQEILSITAAELRRWSKDGRIPTSGRAFFSQGRKQVGLFLYSSEPICALAARPGQIAGWRRSDNERKVLHKQSSLFPLAGR
ncbi:hypothetical protein [Bradyrhizobium sp. STM 3562]|uniref:hypothetical protein n=1 Tax=Bradyrhizobium sp. STM 3562 TaxID=578924 RepID=UPI00388D1B50